MLGKGQQKILWAEVRKATRRGKDCLSIRLADERCSQTILDFIATTQVKRRGPDATEYDARSETSERELREVGGGVQGNGGGEGNWAEGERCLAFLPALFGDLLTIEGGRSMEGSEGAGAIFPVISLVFPWCTSYLFGTGQGGRWGESHNGPRCGRCTRAGKISRRHSLDRLCGCLLTQGAAEDLRTCQFPSDNTFSSFFLRCVSNGLDGRPAVCLFSWEARLANMA